MPCEPQLGRKANAGRVASVPSMQWTNGTDQQCIHPSGPNSQPFQHKSAPSAGNAHQVRHTGHCSWKCYFSVFSPSSAQALYLYCPARWGDARNLPCDCCGDLRYAYACTPTLASLVIKMQMTICHYVCIIKSVTTHGPVSFLLHFPLSLHQFCTCASFDGTGHGTCPYSVLMQGDTYASQSTGIITMYRETKSPRAKVIQMTSAYARNECPEVNLTDPMLKKKKNMRHNAQCHRTCSWPLAIN